MEFTVRQVTLEDADQIFQNLFVKSDLDSVSELLTKDVEKMKLGEFLRCVAEHDGRVVGQSEFTIPEAPIKKHVVEISGMVVMGNHQGEGVSSELFRYGIKWAQSTGVKIALLSVRRGMKAEEVYKHWGFEVYGELRGGIIEPWEGGKTYDEILMYKNL